MEQYIQMFLTQEHPLVFCLIALLFLILAIYIFYIYNNKWIYQFFYRFSFTRSYFKLDKYKIIPNKKNVKSIINKEFLKMKNSGEDLCDTSEERIYTIISYSQNHRLSYKEHGDN